MADNKVNEEKREDEVVRTVKVRNNDDGEERKDMKQGKEKYIMMIIKFQEKKEQRGENKKILKKDNLGYLDR